MTRPLILAAALFALAACGSEAASAPATTAAPATTSAPATTAAPTADAPTTLAPTTTEAAPPATEAAPKIQRDTALAVKDCIDAIGIIGAGTAIEFSETRRLTEAGDICDRAQDLLDVDGLAQSELSQNIGFRLVQVAFLNLKIAQGEATAADAADLDDGDVTWTFEQDQLLDEMLGNS